MRRILSLILAVGLLFNVVIPAYASDSIDIGEPLGKPKWMHWVDYSCGVVGLAAIASVGGFCANPVGGVVCIGCAGWAFYQAANDLINH
jgi:hypothetical protein